MINELMLENTLAIIESILERVSVSRQNNELVIHTETGEIICALNSSQVIHLAQELSMLATLMEAANEHKS